MKKLATLGSEDAANGANQQDPGRSTFVDMRRLLTVRQVSEILNVRESTVYALAARGVLTCIKIGGSLRFNPGHIKDVFEGSTTSCRGL